MQSRATSVKEYLANLPDDRRKALEAVRAMILENLDEGFEEGMQYGMIGYYVPHSNFPAGYHCDPKQPLPFAGLASQKNHMSIHVMSLYSNAGEESTFREQWAKTGKKLDMGKCCIRFKKLEDLAMDVMRNVFRKTTAKKYIQYYLSALTAREGTGSRNKSSAAPVKPESKTKTKLKTAKSPKSMSASKSAKKATRVSLKTTNKKKPKS